MDQVTDEGGYTTGQGVTGSLAGFVDGMQIGCEKETVVKLRC